MSTGQYDWYINTATGEVARPRVMTDRHLVVDLWLQPGAAVAGAHLHDRIDESFEVVEGRIGVLNGGVETELSAGDVKVEVRAGTVHDWWQIGDSPAQVVVEVKAIDGAPGAPARRFEHMIETIFSLGTLGRVGPDGMPDALWLAAIGSEYGDVIRFRKPPRVVQAIVFGLMAAIARRAGRNPLDPSLHGPDAPCRRHELTVDDKAALLAGKAPTTRHS
jgi:mannose-6-phosphate isomerase-like protein (cupin superfamily)